MTIDKSTLKSFYEKLRVCGLTFVLEDGGVLSNGPERYRLTFRAGLSQADFLAAPRAFSKAVSIGMIEHVGRENLRTFFETVRGLLREGGIFLAHMISGPNEHIFPGGHIPGIKEIVAHACESGFMLVDAESLRRHYAKTLASSAKNFEDELDEIRKTKDERFIRMWRLYLGAGAASFGAGNIDIHQVVLTKGLCDEIPWTRAYLYR